MRTYIGGEERVFPARWFFCDPAAQWFPSPHGAEASPWLKDGEVNEWWGEIKGRKTLDRGINPGYPGNCFVGKPQWFVDGILPATIVDTPHPLPTTCCGHVPPENPDPRCPPYRAVGPCPQCKEEYQYTHYTLTLSGGTGDFARFNGTVPLPQADIFCGAKFFDFTTGNFYNLFFSAGPGVAVLLVSYTDLPGFPSVTYTGPHLPACLEPMSGWPVTDSIGIGTPPDFVIF